MAKALHRLTAKEVENAPKGSTLSDGGGLSMRTGAQGNRRWVLRFKLKGQPQREMGLGAFPATTLAQARKKAAAARELVSQGIDPIDAAEREAEAARAKAAAKAAEVMTFGRYADEVFLPTVLPNFTNEAHIQQWEATFRKHAASLRDLPLVSITREHVLDVLRPIWTTKSVTASRSRERLERLFSHATQNGAYSADNPAAWRQFDATLPAPRKLTHGHHASIPHDEIAPFIEKLRERQAESTAALMLEWIALSACRTGEARFATWAEIDLDRMIWAVPAARMKMRRDHVVPITKRMGEVLDQAKGRLGRTAKPSDWLFPGPRKGKPLSEMAGIQQMKRMDYGQFTVHGLRATFKGWAATTTEFPRELIEEQLAHQLGAVERAYMRVHAVERRRVMMEAWSDHLSGLEATTGAANVVPMRTG
ncbi:MAG: integrase arm-type DNA-binding domain-containing protein [Roseicyclus sp.]|jgi:integrase|nr:integrase arm-type DNA-binding domain-containing protein [Roseicyclus sp.]